MNRFVARVGTRGQIVRPAGDRGAGSRQVTALRYYPGAAFCLPTTLTSCRRHGLMQRCVRGLAPRHLEPIMSMLLFASERVDSTVTAELAAIVPAKASARLSAFTEKNL